MTKKNLNEVPELDSMLDSVATNSIEVVDGVAKDSFDEVDDPIVDHSVKDDEFDATVENSADGQDASDAKNSSGSSPKSAKKKKKKIFDANPDTEYRPRDADIKWQQVKNYKSTATLCKGEIISIEPREEGELNDVIVSFNDMDVIIPGAEMGVTLTEAEKQLEPKKLVVVINKILSRMLGAKIDFIIKDCGVKNGVPYIYGSRKTAMMRLRATYRTEENGVYRINEGDVIRNARVIGAGFSSMRVEAFGVEMDIMKNEISYEWVNNIRDKYPVGSTCNIYIEKIEDRLDPENITIKASIKKTEKNLILRNMARIKIEGRYKAEVISISKRYIYLFIPTHGVRAAAMKVTYPSDFPNVGDIVAFVAQKKYDDAGIVLGNVASILVHKQ